MPGESGEGAAPPPEHGSNRSGPIGPDETKAIVEGAEAFLRERHERRESTTATTGSPGPIMPGEAAEIAAGAEAFLKSATSAEPTRAVSSEPYYRLSDAPKHLKRRVVLRPPENPVRDSWIPFKELSRELSNRLNTADYCWMRMIIRQGQNPDTGEWTLTPAMVTDAYEEFKRSSGPWCDLHDVYVAGEARYLGLEQEAQVRPEAKGSLDRLGPQYTATLKAIGEALPK